MESQLESDGDHKIHKAEVNFDTTDWDPKI